ncbi:uncharacterized protein LOC126849507 [Cataglyphis hispanica]|uniref:uncharacterized protein LOC126849507 n=1 Tax=Cataglyphis hispanica TaxID=1086592 RepID=UPI00217F4893|nr:uncharacterized protein LOC126849507 [Cataglyphis hispanica]
MFGRFISQKFDEIWRNLVLDNASTGRRMDPLVQGASLENIVKYVLRHTRLTDARARYLVVEVLKAGIALGRIKRTPHSTYVLASSKTAIAPRITEPKFRDNSSCSSFSE